MQLLEGRESCLAPVCDFQPGTGWKTPEEARERSRWCCEQLEDNRILFFETFPFAFPEEDRNFLASQLWSDSRFHKNISYRPRQDVLRGFAPPEASVRQRMHEVMRRYSGRACQFLSLLLAPYAGQWSLDYASLRPEAEQERDLPLHKRNDLLHVDAFPSRPTRGGRILRCFTNINPTELRVWQTTDAFPELAAAYAEAAGLASFAGGGFGAWRWLAASLGLAPKGQTAYDRFMLRFHDYLKEQATFQQTCRKVRLEFPPGATWICFTDSVPHAVLSGQYAVEQTLIVPMDALLKPEQAPLRVLEGLAGCALVPRQGRASR